MTKPCHDLVTALELLLKKADLFSVVYLAEFGEARAALAAHKDCDCMTEDDAPEAVEPPHRWG